MNAGDGFSTDGYAGYSVAFSPFYPDLIATAASSNFGIVGNGRLYVKKVPQRFNNQPTSFDTQDGLFDLAFSEIHDKQLVTASGDGTIHLWDWSLPVFIL